MRPAHPVGAAGLMVRVRAVMNLEAIAIQVCPGEQESLALALRAVARAIGADLHYDEVCAALGVSLVAIAGPTASSPAWWPTFGRDAFLAPTARLFGMHLRDLHPPEVGLDMLWAEEFPQHFELSYKPLIRRALENGQPVLAWGSWEANAAPLWGVITASAGADFLGIVPGGTGPVRLGRPALQCYVVEGLEPRTPPAEELMAAVVGHANAYLSRPEALFRHLAPAGSKIVTGPAAYDAWATWLEAQRPGTDDDPAREALRLYACALCAGRTSAARFMGRSDAVQGPNHGAVLDAVMAACESFAAELCLVCRRPEVAALWSTAEGHQELLESIRAAQGIDRQIADYISRLASPA